MSAKTCMITGASSGIGKATAKQLVSLGVNVVMVCRDRERGMKAKTEAERGGRGSVELLIADLASLKSVKELAESYARNHDSLDVLINNAGVARLRRSLTVDGFEATFQVNYLSHFLLTNLMLPLLRQCAPSRIVNVTSISHYGGHMNFNDLQMAKGYGVMKAYSQSKLALVIFTTELARRLAGSGVTANCLHPGAVATNIWGSQLGPASFLSKVTRLFMLSPEAGAETSVYLATSPEVTDVTGMYFENKRMREPSRKSQDSEVAARLWDESVRMVGL